MSKEPHLNPAQELFLRKSINGFEIQHWTTDTAGDAGSNRGFIRISSKKGGTYILVLWDSSDPDWERFFHIYDLAYEETGLVPEIVSYDSDNGFVLVEDLGVTTLNRALSEIKSEERKTHLYERVLAKLSNWHELAENADRKLKSRILDKDMFLWESSYFFQYCVKGFFMMGELGDKSWERERDQIANEAASCASVFIHRDFQSENIMISKDNIRFIDFQGARMGPPEYDIASLLFDPYTDMLTIENVEKLVDYYSGISNRKISRDIFYTVSLQRLMQALGAYSNLGLNMGKSRFLEYIPAALERLRLILSMNKRWPVLKSITGSCVSRLNS